MINFLSKTPIDTVKSVLPKHIYMTYHNKSKIPKKVFIAIKKYAPNYKIHVYDDTDCVNFINKYFGPKLVKRFNNFKCGAHKADLFRYCILYIKGGIYFDIKTELIEPVEKTFPKNKCLYTVLSINEGTIFQGIIASPARNFIFLELIKFMYRRNPGDNYLLYTADFFTKIRKRVVKRKVRVGKNEMKPGQLPIYLYKEECVDKKECKGSNKYGLCCFVRDESGKNRIKSRFNDFGIKW